MRAGFCSTDGQEIGGVSRRQAGSDVSSSWGCGSPVVSEALAKATYLWAALAQRLGSLGLELRPAKTKVVYCQDTKRRQDYEHTSFDFLGYTFQAVW